MSATPRPTASRKKSADLGSSRCEVDIKRVYDAVIRPGNLSNAGLILPTCRLFRLSFDRRLHRELPRSRRQRHRDGRRMDIGCRDGELKAELDASRNARKVDG